MSAGFSSDNHHNLTMNKENLFSFPNHFPYDLTEYESHEEDVAGITQRFSRYVSLQQPTYNFKKNRGFSNSPESTLRWSEFLQLAGVVESKNNRGLPAAPRALSHPDCDPWGMSDGEEFFRQQNLCRNNGGCGGRPPGFSQSAWPRPQLQNQCIQQYLHNQHNAPVMKPGGSDGGATAAKRECAGTGVFLPRGYCNNLPEYPKRQACSPPNLLPKMIQSSNKTLVAMTTPPQIQSRINDSFIPNYAQQPPRLQINIRGGVTESTVNNPEVLLPQDWTY